MITVEQLKKIMPQAGDKAALFVDHLNKAMEEFEINTPLRQAAFIAQLAHESAQFRYMEELASGAAYDKREDLGNTRPEAIRIAKRNNTTAGRFWKGHGPIQVTGFDNHLEMMLELGIDCLENPKLLCEPEHGFRAAGHFWKSRDLNAFADVGDFRRITKKINGGYNHLKEREAFYKKAKEILLGLSYD